MVNLLLFASIALQCTTLVTARLNTTTKRGVTFSFPYGSTKVRGVNLGGWLVMEPFITPSIFEATGDNRIIDEYTFGQYQDYNTAHAALVQHWDTWITEADFIAIANAGLNHVRLPIGYWAFDVSAGEPYHQGQYPYVQKAVGWARNHGLKVIIDLHGAPGSQNGYDNSGQKKPAPEWHTQSSYVSRTSEIIKKLASDFASQTDTVVAIAPLNEPAGYFSQDLLNTAKQYWYDSYGNIRYPYGTSQQSNLINMIHDAFQPLDYWKGFQSYPAFDGVIMDTHQYQIFSDAEVRMTQDQHIQTACSKGPSLRDFTLWAIVGEWTLASTDCAKYLNSRGSGARYDGTLAGSQGYVGDCAPTTGDSTNWSADYKTFLRKFWEAQVTSYELGQGWIHWTWKTESADEWSYQKGLAGGWIPSDPSERIYPGICN